MEFEILTTERLKLRKLTPEVFAYVFKNYTDKELMEFFGIATATELEDEKIKFEKGISTYDKSFVYFQLIDKLSHQIIGSCGYFTWYLRHNRAEIGYFLLDAASMQHGLMYEAITEIIRYGFTKMNLHRIEAFIEPSNEPSLKLIRKMSFKQEGHLKEHYFCNNTMEDSLVFSLLKKDSAIN
ncbi:GNAT family N-acetyltransferase [Pedobacter cryoconitis]|uniref:Ribosomal-protein-alanine N-acetyltransferase n=1 Tax=Pedobacter cryoconitis TaxID=188932 RepID=A0A7X0IYZ6_9SPHI|nr:GNAT family protein [Pedobacter cryoconitis]MBB6498044.1 ribosomal-protein-alanine N-acetyltransferase [Pedobacter cryoconitis]